MGWLNERLRRQGKRISTNKKANAEYWDKIDNAIGFHVRACIYNTLEYSLGDADEITAQTIEDISKEVGDIIIARLEEHGADFPYVDEDF